MLTFIFETDASREPGHHKKPKVGFASQAVEKKQRADGKKDDSKQALPEALSTFQAVVDSGKKYQVIYADPPWQYQRSGGGGVAANEYATLTQQQLCAMPIQQIIDKEAGCVLFLWVTEPKLPEALELIKAWGLTYLTCAFCWVKLTKKSKTDAAEKKWHSGMGVYTRSNIEQVLIARYGPANRVKPDDTKQRQLVFAPVTGHSEKPDDVRKRINVMYADRSPKIELFARYERERSGIRTSAQFIDGWDSFGDAGFVQCKSEA